MGSSEATRLSLKRQLASLKMVAMEEEVVVAAKAREAIEASCGNGGGNKLGSLGKC